MNERTPPAPGGTLSGALIGYGFIGSRGHLPAYAAFQDQFYVLDAQPFESVECKLAVPAWNQSIEALRNAVETCERAVSRGP